jgi:hypothetical protein
MNFGDIDSTRFGFGSGKEQGGGKPCFCWLRSRFTLNIRETAPNVFDFRSSHEMRVFCSGDTQPLEEFRANFFRAHGGPGAGPKNLLSIGWTVIKMCGGCAVTSCDAAKTLCREEDNNPPVTTNHKKLWALRSELKQKETEVKGICKDIRKARFKNCKFDMDCKQTKKICEGSGSIFF